MTKKAAPKGKAAKAKRAPAAKPTAAARQLHELRAKVKDLEAKLREKEVLLAERDKEVTALKGAQPAAPAPTEATPLKAKVA